MDKLRLDFYLSVGGELTKGDECYNVENEEANEFIGIVGNDEMYPGYFQFDGKGYGIYSKEDLKQLVITSFAERENKGVQPVPDDFPVIVDYGRGLDDFHNKEAGKTTEWRWVQLWKPDYKALLKMQAEYDLNNFKDTMNHKQKVFKRTPIYTQEMKDNGESPKVGMRCLDRKGNEVVFLGEHKAEAWLESVSNTIDWNAHCDAVKNLKPLKTPEQIEQIELEEAKQKQIADYTQLIYKKSPAERGLGLILFMQEQGMLKEIVLDDLNARGMAKQ